MHIKLNTYVAKHNNGRCFLLFPCLVTLPSYVFVQYILGLSGCNKNSFDDDIYLTMSHPFGSRSIDLVFVKYVVYIAVRTDNEQHRFLDCNFGIE